MDWIDDSSAALLTDLYELTMAASYVAHGQVGPATFDLFVRSLPAERNFLIACGLEQALHYLEHLRFDDRAIEDVRQLGIFDEAFLEHLRSFRFTGEVWAVPEGELVFAEEPLMRVTAPLPEAQFVESFLLNCISFQTMIASKAARVAIASGPKAFVDFSLRRDHGPTAALYVARASWIAGAQATSNVLAAARYGIPPSGTMAHSFVMNFEHEIDAFRQYAHDFPDRAILLIDTYDTLEGARSAIRVAQEVKAAGAGRVRGVRIDSGDLAADARKVRALLDEAGLPEMEIFLSGDLDEHIIQRYVRDGVPADGFGIGTQLGTSGDAPSVGAVYKLAAQDGEARMKLSAGKKTLPGKKQVFRFERGGRWVRDVIGLEEESFEGARPLLVRVMADGHRIDDLGDPAARLKAARARCRQALGSLPDALRSLDTRAHADVTISEGLRALMRKTEARLEAALGGPTGGP